MRKSAESGQIRTNPPGRVLRRTRWRNLKLRTSRTADPAPRATWSIMSGIGDLASMITTRWARHWRLSRPRCCPPLPTASTANSAKRRLNLTEDLVARRASQSKGRASRAAAFVCWMPARRRTLELGACARSRRGLRRSCRADIQACPCRRIPRRSRPAP